VKNLIHEIIHCLHFQFNLGDIHSLPNGANMGNSGNGNDVAMQYFWDNAKLDNKPDKIIVHHSASKTWTYKEILDYHINKGWLDIGYHYLIEKNGIVKRGRWAKKEGTHTIGQNTSSIGICLAGNFNEELPTKEQEQSLKGLLIELNLYNIKPHRAFTQTDCFGIKLSDDWAYNLTRKTMYQLIRKQNDEDVYFIAEDGKRYQIGDYNTFSTFVGKLWGGQETIKILTDLDFNYIKKGGIVVLTKSE